MTDLEIMLEDRPGELARMGEVLAHAGHQCGRPPLFQLNFRVSNNYLLIVVLSDVPVPPVYP